jgi:maltooligosyltrehalose synthase
MTPEWIRRADNEVHVANLEAEIKRLREALERIAEAATSQRRLAVNLNAIEHIAREALVGKE